MTILGISLKTGAPQNLVSLWERISNNLFANLTSEAYPTEKARQENREKFLERAREELSQLKSTLFLKKSLSQSAPKSLPLVKN